MYDITVIIASDGFEAVGLQTGGLKDSQITASSSRAAKFLPYSARVGNSLGGWIPLKSLGADLLSVHFIQVDLRKRVQIKMVRILFTLFITSSCSLQTISSPKV